MRGVCLAAISCPRIIASRASGIDGQADFNHCGISGASGVAFPVAVRMIRDSNRACLDGSVRTVHVTEMGKDYTDPGDSVNNVHYMTGANRGYLY